MPTYPTDSCQATGPRLIRYTLLDDIAGMVHAVTTRAGGSSQAPFDERNLAKAGYNVTKYVPYGPVESVMPYLLRRASENTSVAGQSSRELSLIRKELRRRKHAKA